MPFAQGYVSGGRKVWDIITQLHENTFNLTPQTLKIHPKISKLWSWNETPSPINI
jgi:hypothetical protein